MLAEPPGLLHCRLTLRLRADAELPVLKGLIGRTYSVRRCSPSQQQLLYELASGRRATAGTPFEPHPEGLQATLTDHRIALWASWEALALPDRVCFLAHRSDDFNRSVLAHNVEADYFQLYLLTLYQKLRLSLLAGELQRRRTSLHDNLVDARALSRDFAMFRNHYWYAEVTLKAQGGASTSVSSKVWA